VAHIRRDSLGDIGALIRSATSSRSARCRSENPSKPSFRAMRMTVGVDTPAASASSVTVPSPEIG